jgi:purine-binding chemotaxis protein CheW
VTATLASTPAHRLVVFLLDERAFAVELGAVERVLRMVAVTPVPRAPDVVLGVFDYQGQVLPVMNVRRRFGLPERAVAPSDQLLLLRTPRRRLAFAVDRVDPAIAVPAGALVAADEVVPGLEHVRGIVRLEERGLVLVHDIETFLSLDESQRLDAALKAVRV